MTGRPGRREAPTSRPLVLQLKMHNLVSESPKSKHVTAPGLLCIILTWKSENLYVPDLPLTHTCIPTGRKEETTAIPEVLPAIVVAPLSMGAGAAPLQGVIFMLYSKWHFLMSS